MNVPNHLIGGRYRVVREIAAGGMGTVYEAQHALSKKSVALKIMHRELAADANLVARFRREGEVLIKLRDRHIVETYEVGETPEGLPFIAMELLEGEPLLRLFHLHVKMAWHRVFAVARAICRALGHAHAVGIIHRDLKPGNVFITKDGGVKVLDFGIAKIVERPVPLDDALTSITSTGLTSAGAVLGTPEHMSPEQCQGARLDFRSDVYACGILLYQLDVGD